MSSQQKAILQALANRANAGEIEGLEDFFTEEFVLHDPATPDWPTGKEGARTMMAAFAGIRLDILDMVEEGDRVCVRWSFSGLRDGAKITASCMATYRFKDGRIAEDWGLTTRRPWP